MSRFVDLSHSLEHGAGAYRGMPEPVIEPHWTREESAPRYDNRASFEITRVELVGSTGTYIDAPYHRFDGEDDLSMIPLEILAGIPAVVVDGVDLQLEASDVRGRAVLFRTGWSERWGTDAYWEGAPYLPAATLDVLVGAATIVGVDFCNVDDVRDPSRPAHTRLLSAGIPIVEHLRNLAAVPARGARFFAAPLAIKRGACFPVRAFAEIT